MLLPCRAYVRIPNASDPTPAIILPPDAGSPHAVTVLRDGTCSTCGTPEPNASACPHRLAAARWAATQKAKRDQPPTPDAAPLTLEYLRDWMGDCSAAFPTLTIRIAAQSRPVVIRRAGDKSRFPGALTVTDSGEYGADQQYFGRVRQDGKWSPARDCPPAVRNLLRSLADSADWDGLHLILSAHEDPATCPFCGQPTTNELFHPACGEHYGAGL